MREELLYDLIQSEHIYKEIKYEEKYSLGHLGYVFVSQAHPQVIVLMQQDLLLTGVSHAAGIVPGERISVLLHKSCQLQL